MTLLNRFSCVLCAPFVALVCFLCMCCDAFASCAPGQYTICDLDPQYGSECNDCGCVNCPVGQTSDGTGVVYNCSGYSPGNSGCYTPAPSSYCAGYTNCPSGVGGTGKKCKAVDGCPSGCQKYEVCDTATGTITSDVSPSTCSLINGMCQLNSTKDCEDFNTAVDYSCWNMDASRAGAQKLVCNKSNQVGTATWTGTSWDVSNCRCHGSGYIYTKKCSGSYVLKGLSYSAADDTITYGDCENNIEGYYCSGCAGGLCPSITSNDNNNLCHYNDGGGYVACGCSAVAANYYSTGFTVSYPLSGGTTNCAKSCGFGLNTMGATGATSASACEIDTAQKYQDAIGTFTLGTDTCSN